MPLVLSACRTFTVSPVFIFAHFHNVAFFYAVNGFAGGFDDDAFSVILKVLLDFPRGRNGHILTDRHLTVLLLRSRRKKSERVSEGRYEPIAYGKELKFFLKGLCDRRFDLTQRLFVSFIGNSGDQYETGGQQAF